MSSIQRLAPNDITELELKTLPVLKDLSLENLENLLSVCQLKTFNDKEYLIKEGSYDPWIFILLEGKVSVIVEQLEVTVIHSRGALFGEAALIDDSPRKADVLAQPFCKCLCIDSVLMKEVLCTTNMMFYAHFYKHISKLLSERLSSTSEELSLVKRAFNAMLNTS